MKLRVDFFMASTWPSRRFKIGEEVTFLGEIVYEENRSPSSVKVLVSIGESNVLFIDAGFLVPVTWNKEVEENITKYIDAAFQREEDTRPVLQPWRMNGSILVGHSSTIVEGVTREDLNEFTEEHRALTEKIEKFLMYRKFGL